MKKLISLLLCALMLASLSLTAFAVPPIDGDDKAMSPASTAEPGVELMTTAHEHDWEWQYSYNGGYVPKDGGCAAVTCHKWQCSCGATYESRVTGSVEAHRGGTVYYATCNGTLQTWYYHNCSKCGGDYTITKYCPGKDHKNGCQWLPL